MLCKWILVLSTRVCFLLFLNIKKMPYDNQQANFWAFKSCHIKVCTLVTNNAIDVMPCTIVVMVVQIQTCFYPNSSSFMLYAIIKIQPIVFWVIHTTPIEVYCFINKTPTILFLDNICSYNCDMPCTDTPCVLTDHSEPILSPGDQYKICPPLCIFVCNLLH